MMLLDYQYIEKALLNIELREVLRLQGYQASTRQASDDIQIFDQGQIKHGFKLSKVANSII
jgi:hypothetical protein